MNALEKVAWAELGVTIVASVAVLGTYPWFGDLATKLFALLGLVVVFYPLFMFRRGDAIIQDERDLAIERKSKYVGSCTAWMFLFTSLISLSMFYGPGDMPTRHLFSLIWIQFAVYFGVKSIVAVLGYRGMHRAA